MLLSIVAETGATVWAVLLGEGAPLIAALVVSIVLARGGFHEKLSAYRQDTLTLMQMRSETMEKQLEEAQTEVEELRREARRRERHIEYLELELEGRRPARKALRKPTRPADDVDDVDDADDADDEEKT